MRKYLFVFLLTILFFCNKSVAQKKEVFDTSRYVHIDLQKRRVDSSIALDKSTYSFSLKTLPDTMVITYTAEDYMQRRIIFYNKGKKDSLIVTWSGSGDNIENLRISDFVKGNVTLVFSANQLINIGNRETPIRPRSFANWDTWVKIEPLPDAKAKPTDNADNVCDKQLTGTQKIMVEDTTAVISAITCILCQKLPKCPDSAPCAVKEPHKNEKHKTGKTTPVRYICVYDIVRGESWYADYIDSSTLITDITTIRPNNGSLIKFVIRGTDLDEDYVVTADGQTFFMEGGANAQDAINGDFGFGNTSDTKQIADEQKPKKPAAPEPTDIPGQKAALLDNINSLEAFRDVVAQLDTTNKTLSDTIHSQLYFLPKQKKEVGQDLINKFTTTFNQQLIKLADSLAKLPKSKAVPPASTGWPLWKPKFMALDKILEDFNSKYSSIDFQEVAYSKDLAIIEQGIKSCLHIPVTRNSDDLRKALEVILCSEVAPEYMKDCRMLIESIAALYKAGYSKTTHRKMYYKSIQVPDADQIKVTVTGKKNNNPILERQFHVRGWKIDFSTGVFYNGLGKWDYSLAQSTFRYYETRDSFFISNGTQVDSIHYTGRILDTTGNFIKRSSNRVNYGAGFFVHVYKRSGKAWDFGGGVGFQLNTSGQALVMLGIGPMVKVGSSRVSIIGGVTLGKGTHLTAAAKPYVYQSYYSAYDQANSAAGTSVFSSKNALPRFYNSGTDLKADTYDKIGWGFFAGVTFNFAGFSLSKSK